MLLQFTKSVRRKNVDIFTGADILIHNAVTSTPHYATLIFSVKEKTLFLSARQPEQTVLKCRNYAGHTPGQIIILSNFHN